jgi:hypothetical protein
MRNFKRCLKDYGISLYFFDKTLWNTLDTEEIYSPSINRTAISVAKQMIKETRPIKAD